MPTIEGYITNKDTKEGFTNNKMWKLWKFEVNNTKMSTFDKTLDKFNTGDFVKVEAEKTDKGCNILTMEEVPITKETPKPAEDGKVFIRHSELMLAAVKTVEVTEKVGVISKATFDTAGISPVDMVSQVYQTLLKAMKEDTEGGEK